jgi:spore germination protein GerM
MTDQLREILSDAVADVEPRYALDDIRARTTTKRRWPYAAGGAVLAIAASVAAFSVLGPDKTPRAADPASSTPSVEAPSPTGSVTDLPSVAAAIYYVGDTPDGPRLYREFTRLPVGQLLSNAVQQAMSGPAMDPDYRTAWPQGAHTLVSASLVDGIISIEVDEAAVAGDPDLSPRMAQLAVEQVIYTAQAVAQERLPVQFTYRGNPVAEVLGVPTSEPLANGKVLDTLAHVSLTTPGEGMLVDNDEPFVVEGVGNSFEGNIVTRIQRWEGTFVVDQLPATAGWLGDKLFPFEVTFDLTDVPPGDYVVISQTDDASGQGRFHTDSRRITVVE